MEEKAFLEKYLKKFKYKWITDKIHSSKGYFDGTCAGSKPTIWRHSSNDLIFST